LDAHGTNARSRSPRGNSRANHFFIFKAAPSIFAHRLAVDAFFGRVGGTSLDGRLQTCLWVA
jgi:hypothetical protein